MMPDDWQATALNFSWLVDQVVAGCRGPRTDDELVFLASAGIGALVRLASEDETGLTAFAVERAGMCDCYEPVTDWTAPSQKQIDRILRFIHQTVHHSKAVAVSCGAGYGRTGTILACYLVSTGLTAEEAMQKLFRIRPCSREIMTIPGQADAVVAFQRRRR